MIIKCLDGTEVNLLSKGSSKKVLVKCEDCLIEFITDYRNIIHTCGKWCKKCCHKYKRKWIRNKEQLKKLSEDAKNKFTGRKVSEETKKKIGNANRTPLEYYKNLFKINDRIRYDQDKWLYRCNECNKEFQPTTNQVGEFIRQCKRNKITNNFCSKECRLNYFEREFSHTRFKPGHNLGGTSWNRGNNTPEEIKKKISDGFNKNSDMHRHNMRLAAIKRVQKLKEEGKILTYPNRGNLEIKCINELKQEFSEFTIIENKEIYGYFIDAYIEGMNLAIEFDERHHFKYNDNGQLILNEPDIKRQHEIENFCNCCFFRINELDWCLKKEEIKNELRNKIKGLVQNKGDNHG